MTSSSRRPGSLLRRTTRFALLSGGVALGLLASLVILQNALLNFALPVYLDTVADRVRVEFTWAWMVVPGHVFVYGLDVSSRGQRGEMVVRADRASGVIALSGLPSRRFHARAVRGSGVTFISRPYGDEALRARWTGEGGPAPGPVPGGASTAGAPPELDAAAGQGGAPLPAADEAPLVSRWSLRLDDIIAVDLREIDYHDYRLLGYGEVTATVNSQPPFLDLDAMVTFREGRIVLSGEVVADRATGSAKLKLRRMDQRLSGDDNLAALSGAGTLEADVRDLRFLDFYLKDVPWLSFGGVGTTRLTVAIDGGELSPGTELVARFPELIVRLLGTLVRGSGVVRAAVALDEHDEPFSSVFVDLRGFDLVVGDEVEPLIRGDSLFIDLRSPDVSLFEPFAVDVSVVLPPSHIANVAGFNAFLPAGIGLELVSGEGAASGELRSTAADGRGWGALNVASEDLVARLDDLDIVAAVSLEAVLADAHFEDGRYGLEGTKVHLRRLGVRDRTDPDGRFTTRGWASTLSVASGAVELHKPLYLDVSMNIWATDSGPFVAVLNQKQPLPKWAQGAMTVDGLVGAGRVRLGPSSMEIGPFALRGGKAYELRLRYLKDGRFTYGVVFTRAGPLSLGVGMRPSGTRLHLLGASRWFADQEATRAWGP
jgi:hypothetical protein